MDLVVAEKDFALKPGMHFHIVGIGGAGMSAIARVLHGRGFTVSGSDAQSNSLTAELEREGATIYAGHAATQIAGADALVISSAIPNNNVEVIAARSQGVPVLKRADLLGLLMDEKIGIAVAGTHGKTTTTAMIAQMLVENHLDPSVILGGVLPEWGTNGRFGEGDYFIVEADEYDNMFLGLRPELAVVTNIEHDHPDVFPSAAVYLEAFRRFTRLLPGDGRLVVCGDDPGVQQLLNMLGTPNLEITTYGIGEAGATFDYQALDIRPNQLGGSDFLVQHDGHVIGLVRLRLPGLHNVRNALAALIVGMDLELDFGPIVQSLAQFGGVGRRFQVTGEAGGVTIIDDYAHHPTEIRATLAAARQRYPGRRLWAVWQPHTFSRTRMLLDQFAISFDDAERVLVLDIYRSRETNTLGINSALVVKAMQHPSAVHVPTREAAAEYLLDRVLPGDVILTLGAGDGDQVGVWVLEGLRRRIG